MFDTRIPKYNIRKRRAENCRKKNKNFVLYNKYCEEHKIETSVEKYSSLVSSLILHDKMLSIIAKVYSPTRES